MVIKSPTDDSLAAGGPFEGASVAVSLGYPDSVPEPTFLPFFLSRNTESVEFSSVADADDDDDVGLMAVTEMNLFNRLVCRGSCSVCVRLVRLDEVLVGEAQRGLCHPHSPHYFIRWFPFHQKLNLRVCF